MCFGTPACLTGAGAKPVSNPEYTCLTPFCFYHWGFQAPKLTPQPKAEIAKIDQAQFDGFEYVRC